MASLKANVICPLAKLPTCSWNTKALQCMANRTPPCLVFLCGPFAPRSTWGISPEAHPTKAQQAGVGAPVPGCLPSGPITWLQCPGPLRHMLFLPYPEASPLGPRLSPRQGWGQDRETSQLLGMHSPPPLPFLILDIEYL